MIPVYNEVKVLPVLLKRLLGVMPAIRTELGVQAGANGQAHRSAPAEVEILFVNDGGSDGSLGVLESFMQKNPEFRCVTLSRKQGESKYSFRALAKVAFRGILSTSTKPLLLSGLFTIISVILVVATVFYALFSRLWSPAGSSIPKGRASLASAAGSRSQILPAREDGEDAFFPRHPGCSAALP